jgi:hypothetical protein
MHSFSQRKGLKPIKSIIQKESMDDELRTRLWNALYFYYFEDVDAGGYPIQDMYVFARSLWAAHFKYAIDTLPMTGNKFVGYLRQKFFKFAWNEVYDLIEAVITYYPYEPKSNTFIDHCNYVLEQELAAYRIVGGHITDITSEQEIAAIEDALAIAPNPVKAHLDRALELFADRENSDYRNSIKESISAVEAIVVAR